MTDLTQAEDTLKILLVEDKEADAEAMRRTLEEVLEPVEVHVEQGPDCFERALSALAPPRSYEAVVLDLYLGDPTDENNKVGQRVWEEIWRHKLIPVIVYTGGVCDLEPEVPEDNPFLKCFSKGYGKDEEVALYLQSLKPHILALRQVEQEFNLAIRGVLQDVSPLIWHATEEDQELRSELLIRSARRRLAAMMDMKTASTDEALLSWEQYVYPALGDSLLTGDILRIKDGAVDDPTTYRLVLTPSCDMQPNKKGKCKVGSILVAKCTHISEYVRVVNSNVKPKKPEDLNGIMPRLLTEPHQSGFVPLPEYKTLLPCMAVNLRDLELIAIAEIDAQIDSGKKYRRIVSVDSPFREQITWAYLQISGRPGLPDRDLGKWTKEILEASSSKPPHPAAGVSGSSNAAPREAVTPRAAASDALRDEKTERLSEGTPESGS